MAFFSDNCPCAYISYPEGMSLNDISAIKIAFYVIFMKIIGVEFSYTVSGYVNINKFCHEKLKMG